MKIVFAFLSVLTVGVVFGCSATQVHTSVEKALVFEQQVQSESIQLKAVADSVIPTLPEDKQADARTKLTDAYSKLSAALAAKDALLHTALDASRTVCEMKSSNRARPSHHARVIS
jgi:hypothetical protein